ncbi:hypothetical protein CA54_56650 [Symmachiella macrocystis]|uniref:Uncharacterized protein n=1 Tax=Symmachiella macrocystis TaxID=2527985 RepID=A0A5C6B5N9_9PLAN|nr:hypothetical protein CA54_56650 [Symmachiella macrocystis]
MHDGQPQIFSLSREGEGRGEGRRTITLAIVTILALKTNAAPCFCSVQFPKQKRTRNVKNHQ